MSEAMTTFPTHDRISEARADRLAPRTAPPLRRPRKPSYTPQKRATQYYKTFSIVCPFSASTFSTWASNDASAGEFMRATCGQRCERDRAGEENLGEPSKALRKTVPLARGDIVKPSNYLQLRAEEVRLAYPNQGEPQHAQAFHENGNNK